MVVETITRLQTMGFVLWAEDGKVRYRQIVDGPVDQAEFQKLIEILKEHKIETLRLLTNPNEANNDDELIARHLQYLNGIDEALTGWTMWRRIEGGKEYRYARDTEGRIRWERWFELEPIVIIEPASAESVDTEPTSAESASDLMPEQIEPCYACGERKWWISIYGVRVCGVCHPPAAERLVKEWIKVEG
ncbi:MAG: hypothetical protein K6U11_12605 [bacterium]|nr:hypothetical protein [bacterium]